MPNTQYPPTLLQRDLPMIDTQVVTLRVARKRSKEVHCTCGVAHFHILLVAAFKVCRRRPSPISCDITPSVATSSCNTVLCVVDQGKVKVDHETMFAMIIEVH